MRTLYLTLVLSFCFASGAIAQNVNVTFRVDMRGQTFSPSGIHIAGSFQSAAGLGPNWDPGSTLMHDANGDDIYELTVSIPPGTYEYKFINGNAWGMEENPPSDCSIGTNHNREVAVGITDLLLPAVPFNGCIVTLKLTVNMTGQTISPNGVHVMGDFQQAAGFAQNWDPTSITLTDLNKDGTYEVVLTLPFGEYEYLFVNGNTTVDAEDLPTDCTVLGDNGKQNRQFNYTTGDDSPNIYCFGGCSGYCHPSVLFDYDTYWWNDAVFYEIFVRSFYDSSGDGKGDFRGLTEKLDYLNDGDPETHDDLGITGIWLMPIFSSPTYHGYDAGDYYSIEPDYGTMQDFENFLDAAHARGIKVILDLMLNHVSSQNQWFYNSQQSINDYRNWFRWSDTDPGTIGPWGQTVWHPGGGDYYYGLFWSGMPDVNYTYAPAKEAMFDVVDFWLDKGVDGYRLDAVKYLVEEGNAVENTPGTFTVLEELHDLYKANYPDAFTVGEVWSSTQSIIPYVQHEKLDACFEFGLAGAMIEAAGNGNTEPLDEQLATVLASYPMLQYGTFLTNHDIDRVFSALGSDVAKMKLAASLYLTMPGVPFIYYGEEIGMTGTGDHPNIRRPMQWSDDANGGFTTVAPWYGVGGNYLTNNVEDMEADPNSLLNHYKKLIQIRHSHEALRRGHTLLVEDNAADVISYARVLDHEAVIVVSNTGASPVDPLLSLERSSLAWGQYYVTELLTGQFMGKMVITKFTSGINGWQSDSMSLAGRSTWILSLTQHDPTAVAEPTYDNLISIIPNPASGSFVITLDGNVDHASQIQIHNASGQLVFHQKIEGASMHVETSGWAEGVYYVQMMEGNRSVSGAVMMKIEK